MHFEKVSGLKSCYMSSNCIINRGFVTQSFILKTGSCQGDPLLAYLFIITLEVLFALIKNKVDLEGIIGSYIAIHCLGKWLDFLDERHLFN